MLLVGGGGGDDVGVTEVVDVVLELYRLQSLYLAS